MATYQQLPNSDKRERRRTLHSHKPAHLITPIRIALRGAAILSSPRFNKGTGFAASERAAFGLEGRLPFRSNTLDEQCARAYEQLQDRKEMIRKNTFLQSLKDQNWTLYFSLLARHLKELVPVIYTPTEAEAIASYSHLFRRSEGLFLSFPYRDHMEASFLEQTRGRELDLIVVTDAEAILGIGDQGVGGIGISTAKAVIYTLIGGMDPSRSLSVTLDVGTNNKQLLEDSLYVGWPEHRVRGEAYDQFVDQFVQLVRKHYPHALLHFEDFGITNAYRILKRYRTQHAVFNDDIQGTGAVTLACVLAAIRVSRLGRIAAAGSASKSDSDSENNGENGHASGKGKAKLSEQRIVIFGGGSAGMGIATQLRDAMIAADETSSTDKGDDADAKMTKEDATRKFWIVDKQGLLYKELAESGKEEYSVNEAQREFLRPAGEGWAGEDGADSKEISLLEVIKRVRPTVLIGCSTAAGKFTQEVVEAMAEGLNGAEGEGDNKGGARPIILPLSNPSRLVEATPEDLLKWTKGRALVATGSPFDEIKMDVEGKEVEFAIAECNNALIYPGIGFGAILSQAREVTDTMLLAGARCLASLSPALAAAKSDSPDTGGLGEYNGESLLPDFGDAPRVNFEVAVAVAVQAVKEGSAGERWVKEELGLEVKETGEKGEKGDEELREKVRHLAAKKVWVPVYNEYIYDEDGLKDL